jgi:hypothetical protein
LFVRELLSRLWRKWFLTRRAAQGLQTEQFGRTKGTSNTAGKAAVLRLGNPEGADGLNDDLKRLIKELGDAINGSLSESEEIAEAIGRIKSEGYDVLLVLEATIGFTKRDEEADESGAMVTAPAKEPEFRVNAQDVKFLKSLRISLDDAA